jgi:type IV pilus assembly protein PilW
MTSFSLPSVPRTLRGLSLIELMISLLLALLVTGGAIAVFYSNSQTFRATENLSRVQENARAAFEIMSRDIREAGGNPCERDLPSESILNAGGAWWGDFDEPVRGFGGSEAMPGAADLGDGTGGGNIGTGVGQRVTGTEAMQLQAATSNNLTVADHQPGTTSITLNTASHNLRVGDIAMVCDFRQAGIFQISAVTTDTIGHGSGGASPGNTGTVTNLGAGTDSTPVTYSFGCASGSRTGTDCPGADDKRLCRGSEPSDTEATNAVSGSCRAWSANVARITSSRWYIGNSTARRGDGTRGRSLYRVGPVNNGGTIEQQRQEVAADVETMTLAYLPRGGTDYLASGGVTDWDDIVAVRVTLGLVSPDVVGTDGARLQRTMEHVVTLRNRAL